MQINPVPDFMADVYDLLYYVTGNDQIFRGNQSREVLPVDNNYVIYTPIAQKRIGTNVVTFNAEGVDPKDNAPETNSKLLQIDLQIDFYGVNAFSFAEGLEIFSKAGRCNDWLRENNKGIRVLYATDPVDATLVDETRQYINRWYTVLSICLTASVTDLIPWIEEIPVYATPEEPARGTRLRNVDVDFK